MDGYYWILFRKIAASRKVRAVRHTHHWGCFLGRIGGGFVAVLEVYCSPGLEASMVRSDVPSILQDDSVVESMKVSSGRRHCV